MLREDVRIGKRLSFGVTVGLALLQGTALAQFPPPQPPANLRVAGQQVQNSSVQSESHQKATLNPNHMGLLAHASALIGQSVRDSNQREVGSLQDIVLDLPKGRVLGGLIAAGDGAEVFVPSEIFFPASDNRILLNKPKALVLSAPRLSTKTGVSDLDPSRLEASFGHFGVQTPAPAQGTPAQLQSAKALLGARVSGASNTPLGVVEDIILDVPFGKADYVVVKPSVGQTQAGSLIPVPPQALTPQQAGRSLALHANESQFLSGPHFQKNYWTDMATSDFAASVYRHYGLLNQGNGEPTTATGRSPEEIKSAFLRQLVSSAAIPAAEAQKLNIQVHGGRITVSGRVGSEHDKAAILSAATRVVGPANVIDELQVK